jgi:HPt (histidine-containing phosphotransfer) domain-containing protein
MTTTPPGMAAALDRLWAKFLPEIEQRIAVLESAAEALTAGLLTETEREAAHAAAHKLAGSLGTFGMQRGTELARAAEDMLAESCSAEDAVTLKDYAAELRAVVKGRNAD